MDDGQWPIARAAVLKTSISLLLQRCRCPESKQPSACHHTELRLAPCRAPMASNWSMGTPLGLKRSMRCLYFWGSM